MSRAEAYGRRNTSRRAAPLGSTPGNPFRYMLETKTEKTNAAATLRLREFAAGALEVLAEMKDARETDAVICDRAAAMISHEMRRLCGEVCQGIEYRSLAKAMEATERRLVNTVAHNLARCVRG